MTRTLAALSLVLATVLSPSLLAGKNVFDELFEIIRERSDERVALPVNQRFLEVFTEAVLTLEAYSQKKPAPAPKKVTGVAATEDQQAVEAFGTAFFGASGTSLGRSLPGNLADRAVWAVYGKDTNEYLKESHHNWLRNGSGRGRLDFPQRVGSSHVPPAKVVISNTDLSPSVILAPMECLIVVNGNFTAPGIEYCTVIAKGDVTVGRRGIVGATIIAGGTIKGSVPSHSGLFSRNSVYLMDSSGGENPFETVTAEADRAEFAKLAKEKIPASTQDSRHIAMIPFDPYAWGTLANDTKLFFRQEGTLRLFDFATRELVLMGAGVEGATYPTKKGDRLIALGSYFCEPALIDWVKGKVEELPYYRPGKKENLELLKEHTDVRYYSETKKGEATITRVSDGKEFKIAHPDIDVVRAGSFSPNGKWATFTKFPQTDGATLTYFEIETGKSYTVDLGKAVEEFTSFDIDDDATVLLEPGKKGERYTNRNHSLSHVKADGSIITTFTVPASIFDAKFTKDRRLLVARGAYGFHLLLNETETSPEKLFSKLLSDATAAFASADTQELDSVRTRFSLFVSSSLARGLFEEKTLTDEVNATFSDAAHRDEVLKWLSGASSQAAL